MKKFAKMVGADRFRLLMWYDVLGTPHLTKPQSAEAFCAMTVIPVYC